MPRLGVSFIYLSINWIVWGIVNWGIPPPFGPVVDGTVFVSRSEQVISVVNYPKFAYAVLFTIVATVVHWGHIRVIDPIPGGCFNGKKKGRAQCPLMVA